MIMVFREFGSSLRKISALSVVRVRCPSFRRESARSRPLELVLLCVGIIAVVCVDSFRYTYPRSYPSLWALRGPIDAQDTREVIMM